MRTVYLVCYDIRDDRRLRRVFRIMNGFGDPVQYSVFLCELTRRERMELEDELLRVIHHTEDQVLFVHLGPAGGNLVTHGFSTLGQKLTLGPRRTIVV